MKNLLKTFATTVMVSSLFLGGCGFWKEEAVPPKALAIVVANTSNVPVHDFNTKDLNDEIYKTVRSFGQIDVINVDANSSRTYHENYDWEEIKNSSDNRQDTVAKRERNKVKERLSKIVADEPQVDYYNGLKLGARALGTVEDGFTKRMFVYGSGLSTSGLVNFEKGILGTDATKIATMLRDSRELPNLNGVEVIWHGLGATSLPQAPLNGKEAKIIEDVYRKIIEAAGGTLIVKDSLPSTELVEEKRPYVSTVPVAGKKSLPIGEPIDVSAHIEFLPDSSQVKNPQLAMNNLHKIAEEVKSCDIKLLIAGSTAGDVNNDGTMKLSKERALAVCEIFQKLGVKNNRMICVGLGSNTAPWHKVGLGLGPEAATNRKVVVVNADADYGKTILNAL